jgi:DNA-binding NtrC family response regulator
MSGAPLAPIIGVSPAIKRATALVERFAPTTLPILLVGATGTGKELFAQYIHRASRRRGELIDVNCGALPQEIAESLLFGHRRGAFTGAIESVTGHLQRADNGTLFLDEVLHLSLAAQVTLLRALETGEVQPLGDGRKQRVDFRAVSAAQEDTPHRLDGGTFRRDLFQRLAGVVIELPLLAQRPEDIVPLAEHFAAALGKRLEKATTAVLESHAWPGNVRELRLAIERAGCLVDDGLLPPSAISEAIAIGLPRVPQSDRRTNERRGRGADRRKRGALTTGGTLVAPPRVSVLVNRLSMRDSRLQASRCGHCENL